MPLGTLDRTPPPFFRQGPSALSKLVFFSALALFLMVADVRLKVTQPLRLVLAGVLYPAQWLALQPVWLARATGDYFQTLTAAQADAQLLRLRLAAQAQRASQVELLTEENHRLRQLLDLRQQLTVPAQAAQVLFDAADPYTRKLLIDRGLTHGVQAGSPVIDEFGVLGQVTRVNPFASEVSLVVDRDQAVPVLNIRTGARSVAYGDPQTSGAALELRFMAGNADVQVGDRLSTSGVDGVYPPGLSVAQVARVERRADSAFARIVCTPYARVNAARHVMVLQPLTPASVPAPAAAPVAAEPVPRGGRR